MTLHFTEADVARFERYVLRLPGRLLLPDGTETCACWPWLGARSRGQGNRLWYGSFRVGRRVVRAHRFSCLAAGREDCPLGWHRDHLCTFSLCVCPDHVEYVSPEVNQQRKMERRAIGALQVPDQSRISVVSDRGGSLL